MIYSLNQLASAFSKGNIAPTSLTLSGSLTPEQTNETIKAIRDASEFLKVVTFKHGKKLSGERNLYDVGKRLLTRVKQAEDSSSTQRRGINNIGYKYDCKRVQLEVGIPEETLVDNQDNPQFENQTFDGFNTQFSNDLVLLGFEGVVDGDETAGELAFHELRKGWLQKCREDNATRHTTYASGALTYVEILDALLTDCPDEDKDLMEYWVSKSFFEGYAREVATSLVDAQLLINAKEKSYLGYKINVVNQIPAGAAVFSPAFNFALDLSQQIQRKRWYEEGSETLRYRFKLYPDYNIPVKKWFFFIEKV